MSCLNPRPPIEEKGEETGTTSIIAKKEEITWGGKLKNLSENEKGKKDKQVTPDYFIEG